MQLLPFTLAADATPELTGDLSLAQAIDAALRRNPALAVSSYELKAADARVAQAKARPNPEASLQLENFAGSGATRGVEALETTLALSQVIELGGKRAYRVNAANFNRELSGIDRQAQQMDVLAEVTRRFIAVVLAQQAVTLADRATALTDQTHAAIKARVEAARSPQAEQSRAAIARTRARIEQQQAASALQSARRALAALWGARSASFTVATADLFALPEVQPFETLSARLQNNPDFLRFATEERLREAEFRLAQARSKPDLNVSLGVRRFESTSDAALVAGVSMALPLNRNQGGIREAEVRREQLRVQSQTALLQAEATLFGLYQEMLSARMRVTTLRDDALPQAEAALTQTQYGYERGRFSYLELTSAQQELLSLQSAAIDAAADYHRLVAEIERLTGEPITNDYLEAPLP
ncbi:MAG: TolC family protein [Clostridia bacterium]|nr:TolC family protein [Deltaproteobacteria bacterium]